MTDDRSPQQQAKLTHVNAQGSAEMVDVSRKQPTQRTATASACVILGPEIMAELKDQDIQTAKGPVFQTAIIAGTMAAKKTADLIPLCHPLQFDKCKIEIAPISNQAVQIHCTVRCDGKTGVEMEALTGASVAALTIYDMCKAMSLNIQITDIMLQEKAGGKRNFKRQESPSP